MPAGDWIAGGFRDLLTSDEPLPDLEFDPPPADLDADAAKAYDAFVNYYIHQINLMRHLLGENYAVSHADPAGVVIVVHSQTGIPGVIEMSPYRTTLDWQEEVLIAFEQGYLRLELPAPLAINRPGRVTILRDPDDGATPETVVPQMPWTHAMQQQALNFVAAVRGEKTPLCEAAEALEDLRVARQYMALLASG
jgi:predicted dehydrogenase